MNRNDESLISENYNDEYMKEKSIKKFLDKTKCDKQQIKSSITNNDKPLKFRIIIDNSYVDYYIIK